MNELMVPSAVPLCQCWADLIETPAGWMAITGLGEFIESTAFPVSDRASALWIARAEYSGAAADEPESGPAALMARASAYMADYFSGKQPVDTLPVRLDRLSAFTRRVLEETAMLPWGTTTCSYVEVARRIGVPGGARAVGQALGRNPIPIVVPCHRVLAAYKQIGGFGGGVCWKRQLLRLEGIEVA